jgi:hypothetical protein
MCRRFPRQLGTSAAGATWIRADATAPAHPRGPGESGAPAGGGEPVPAYVLEPGGAVGFPTGLVFVRFDEGRSAAAAAAQFARAGYEVARSPDWAPHTAWVRAAGGRVDDSLAGIARLEAIEGVAAVEAQVLTRRSRR